MAIPRTWEAIQPRKYIQEKWQLFQQVVYYGWCVPQIEHLMKYIPTWLIFILRKSIIFWGLDCFTSLGSTGFFSSRLERADRTNFESLAESWDSVWAFDWPWICETSSLATDSATFSSHVLSNEDVLRSSGFCASADSLDDWLLGLVVSVTEVPFLTRRVPAVVETLKSSCIMKKDKHKMRNKGKGTIKLEKARHK